jgi:hypothetical protein
MAKNELGPIGSYQDEVSPTCMFYEDLRYRLGDDETVTSAYVTSTDTRLTITTVGPTTVAIVTDDSGTIPVGQAVKYRVTTTEEFTSDEDVPIFISYETSDDNADSIETTLQVQAKVTK